MDSEEYVATWLYRERMAEARAVAARRALLDSNGLMKGTASDAAANRWRWSRRRSFSVRVGPHGAGDPAIGNRGEQGARPSPE